MSTPASQIDPLSIPQDRLKFRLFALLILLTVVGLALVLWFRPRLSDVVAVLLVTPANNTVSGALFDAAKQAQLDQLKSDAVLTAALNYPTVSNLPLLNEPNDRLLWLGEQLQVEYPQGSQVLIVSLTVPDAQAKDAATLLDAVIEVYLQSLLDEPSDVLRIQLGQSTTIVGQPLL